jgi:hypothetical protein
MKCGVVACAILFLCDTAIAEDRNSKAPQPEQFEIGRLTFFDFGPPFDFYEIFIVRPATAGSSIERITLTPPGHECSSTAKIEVASALITESVTTSCWGDVSLRHSRKGSSTRAETLQEVFGS